MDSTSYAGKGPGHLAIYFGPSPCAGWEFDHFSDYSCLHICIHLHLSLASMRAEGCVMPVLAFSQEALPTQRALCLQHPTCADDVESVYCSVPGTTAALLASCLAFSDGNLT